MKCPKCGHEWTDEGRAKGGRVSRRSLSPEQARAMVKAREKKKKAKDPKDG